MKQKAHIHIIATGGTIAGRADSASATVGYKAGELTVEQLLASVPGLDNLADISTEQLCNIDSKDMQTEIWLSLAHCVEAAATRDDVDGIVITHGTDTLEETAYFLQLTVKTEKPIVLTGAMRPATAISADGFMNLWQSVQVAADASAKGRGVLVVMNGQIDTAEKVTKVNINALQAFQSPGCGPAGLIVDDNIFWQNCCAAHAAREKELFFSAAKITELPKVKIIYGYVGGDDDLFLKAALQDGAKGLVYAACGNGSVPENLTGSLQAASSSGVPVVISTRCGCGMVVLSEETEKQQGFIASGPLNPQKAKILLQLALTKTNDVKEIRDIYRRCL